MQLYAPIAVFCYKRADHLYRCIESLQANRLAAHSDLIIFSDGPKTQSDAIPVQKVRDYIRTITGFKSIRIIEQPQNQGLAQSIILGVTQILDQYGSVIVVEDDLVVSTVFLEYMNYALILYQNEAKVASIHGYCYKTKVTLPDTFFIRGADCWGWATWVRAWKNFEPNGTLLREALAQQGLEHTFDYGGPAGYTKMLEDQIAGRNNSWAIRWHASTFLKNMFTLYPGQSLVQNIGHDNSGENCPSMDAYTVEISHTLPVFEKLVIKENPQAVKAFSDFFKSLRPPLYKRLFRKTKRILQNISIGV